MCIILTAVDDSLAEAWQRFCGDVDSITIHHGSIFDVHCDALVGPANSFGFMDGGIDALYTQRFGQQVQRRLQESIRARHHGELLVGAAEIVFTDDPSFPFIIAAPTMRVPMILRKPLIPTLQRGQSSCLSSTASSPTVRLPAMLSPTSSKRLRSQA